MPGSNNTPNTPNNRLTRASSFKRYASKLITTSSAAVPNGGISGGRSTVTANAVFYAMMKGEDINIPESDSPLVDCGSSLDEPAAIPSSSRSMSSEDDLLFYGSTDDESIASGSEMDSSFAELEILSQFEASALWRNQSRTGEPRKGADMKVEDPDLRLKQRSARSIQSTNESSTLCTNDQDPIIDSEKSSSLCSERRGSSAGYDDRRVSFDCVQVKEFNRILEVNPAVSSGGPAIGIGWQIKSHKEMSIEDWELVNAVKSSSRDRSHDLILSRQMRETLLVDEGYTSKELAQSTRAIRKLRNQRRSTLNKLQVQRPFNEALRKAGRQLKRRFGQENK